MGTGMITAFEHVCRIPPDAGREGAPSPAVAPAVAVPAAADSTAIAAGVAPGRAADFVADHPFDAPPFTLSRRARAEQDAKEYEARGLLNLIVLLTRCVEGTTGSVEDKQQWLRDIADARQRIADLYRAGLRPIPLGDAVRRIVGAI